MAVEEEFECPSRMDISVDPAIASTCEDKILRSENDKDRKYRGLILRSGMRVMLVSDPTAKMSSGAMNVGVGSNSDPKEVQGIAHFLEHMLFLGTEKYPNETDYSKFINTHGGETNAYTDRENTQYYFTIASEQLEPALDRFSAFFVSPLFTESAKSRELNAIESEFQKTLKNDLWREYVLMYSLTDEKHPLNNFSAGNLKSLTEVPETFGIDVREKLLEFYSTHYSSSIMCLCVVGKESLDRLQQLVLPLFSQVKCIENAKRLFVTNPFTDDLLRKV